MKCKEVAEWVDVYWDLPPDDELRAEMDRHFQQCAHCSRQLQQQNIGADGDLFSGETEGLSFFSRDIAGSVMERIYAEESWRVPVPRRAYSITEKFRKRITATIAFFLALFTCSFLYGVFYERDAGVSGLTGLQPVAAASGKASSELAGNLQIAVASISDPIMLKMGPIQTVNDYLLALSLIGVIGTLLILNWFSRICSEGEMV